MFDNSFPACAFFVVVYLFVFVVCFLGVCECVLFVCFFVFVLKWRLARAHLFQSFGQDQSTVAQRAETTVTECSPTSCV